MFRFAKRDDEGFTLVELLVVMIVIGVLAAIAVPTFLSQKGKAADTAAKSDIRNLVSQMQGLDGGYLTAQGLHDNGIDFKASPNTTLVVVSATSTTYCIGATNTKSSKASAPVYGIATKIFYFDSTGGTITSADASGPGCLMQGNSSLSNGYFDSTGFHAGTPRF